jgi:hypothetical protein
VESSSTTRNSTRRKTRKKPSWVPNIGISEYREAKNKARLQGEALEADWGSQLALGRWDAVTREASKAGASIGFLEPETAKARAISHAFEKQSVLKESLMIAEALKWGIGKIPVRQAEAFVRSFVSVARRTTVRDSVNVVDDFYDIYG